MSKTEDRRWAGLHDLEYLASFESGAGQEDHRTGDVSRFHAHHVRIFVISEIGHVLGLVDPRIPDDGIREVVLLDAHLASRDDVCYDVLLRSVLVYSVCPLVYSDDISTFLVYCALARLVYKRAAVQAGDLTPSHVRNLEIRMQQQVKAERQILARIVRRYVKM